MKPSQSLMEPLQPAVVPGIELPENQSLFRNDAYQVHVTRFASDNGDGPDLIHLSIKRLDKLAIHDWRDLQWIKNQIVGEEQEAVELYPAESRLVDTSNQYHLWCLIGFKFPFGFNSSRMVSEAIASTEFGSNNQRRFAPHVRPRDLAERQAEFIQLTNDPTLARRVLMGDKL